jgi:hypothetical protein
MASAAPKTAMEGLDKMRLTAKVGSPFVSELPTTLIEAAPDSIIPLYSSRRRPASLEGHPDTMSQRDISVLIHCTASPALKQLTFAMPPETPDLPIDPKYIQSQNASRRFPPR